MGGGRRFPYPKWVWTPAGGWWGVNPNGNRNAIILLSVYSVILFGVYQFGESRTTVYHRKYGADVVKEAEEHAAGIIRESHH